MGFFGFLFSFCHYVTTNGNRIYCQTHPNYLHLFIRSLVNYSCLLAHKLQRVPDSSITIALWYTELPLLPPVPERVRPAMWCEHHWLHLQNGLPSLCLKNRKCDNEVSLCKTAKNRLGAAFSPTSFHLPCLFLSQQCLGLFSPTM